MYVFSFQKKGSLKTPQVISSNTAFVRGLQTKRDQEGKTLFPKRWSQTMLFPKKVESINTSVSIPQYCSINYLSILPDPTISITISITVLPALWCPPWGMGCGFGAWVPTIAPPSGLGAPSPAGNHPYNWGCAWRSCHHCQFLESKLVWRNAVQCHWPRQVMHGAPAVLAN